ncbi:MAG: methicillin resistance protein [uncultured bacterium]|nr:MAG: methicillin resistance protein [uncultured bacterium]
MNNNKNDKKNPSTLFFNEDFLMSVEWLKFQKAIGRNTHRVRRDNFLAGIIEHNLPIVGNYFYCPRGPVFFESEANQISSFKSQVDDFIGLAKKENIGWIRIEPTNEKMLNLIKDSIDEKVMRAPHDMQPKEIFVMSISKTEDKLLEEMKSKTRYNINLARKKGVIIKSSLDVSKEVKNKYVEEFLRLTQEMAARNGISAHAQNYYRKMIESFPEEMLVIYVAEYEGNIIAANLMLFHGKCATYLHGASGNENRNVMAPFLLQWQAILDAKKRNCESYDFGGVQTEGVKHQKHSDLVGVTNFKLGFSPNTKTIEFPGSYDIIINPKRYWMYRGLQRAKSFAVRFRK